MRLSINEINELKRQTSQELHVTNPEPVLLALGLDYQTIGNTSYRMKLREEKDASAFISLKNGEWKFRDFGTGQNGTIENIVMQVTNKEYKDALNFSLQTLNIKNRLEIALEQEQIQIRLNKEERERIEALKASNIQKEKGVPISRVTEIRDIESYQLAVDYLKSRGIEKIPPEFKLITGEYTTKDGITKKAFGVGILTQSGGADIHFLKKIGDLKTISFGDKDISFFQNKESKKLAVFESKMDYASAYQQMDLSKVNVVIANTTSNAFKVSELINGSEFESVCFFNQNDKAGELFVKNIVQETALESFHHVIYENEDEGKDINDLHIEGKSLHEHIKQISKEQFLGLEKEEERGAEMERENMTD